MAYIIIASWPQSSRRELHPFRRNRQVNNCVIKRAATAFVEDSGCINLFLSFPFPIPFMQCLVDGNGDDAHQYLSNRGPWRSRHSKATFSHMFNWNAANTTSDEEFFFTSFFKSWVGPFVRLLSHVHPSFDCMRKAASVDLGVLDQTEFL